MKSSFWLIVLISCLAATSCEKANNAGQQIYFNSFESQSDTTGWKGHAFNFANDVPEHGGKTSLSVSGGCVLPHAEYIIKPQSTDSYLSFKFWGKNLSNGGYVFLSVNKAGYKEISFDVTEKDWTMFESKDTLFCPANTSLTLGIIAGGIAASSIVVDMIEIRKLDVNP
jgi:hypothetical protein